jgi:predicted amidohydrolase YtcJ
MIFVLLAACLASHAAARESAADRVLVNGNILTVDARDSVAEAVAIRDGRIIAVGGNAEIEALAGPGTDRIDLGGLTATPGLLDSHIHLSYGGLLKLTQADLSFPGVKSIGDIVRLVSERHAASLPGEWILGRGWDEGKLEERRYVLASDLDPATGGHPAWLAHTMGHYGVANSAALEIAGITRDTPDPAGGVIDRDEEGNPTGVLKETAAIDTWNAYRKVLADGDLTVRVFALWRTGSTLEEARELAERIGPFSKPWESTGDDRLVSGGVKLFADGSGGARTAWVWRDWNRNRSEIDEGNSGYPAIDAVLLRDLIMFYHDAGLHMGVHAVGDRAIDWTVAAMTLALIRNPRKGLRHSIIHSNIPTDLALDTMAALQQNFDAGYPEPQANFTWWIGDTYAGNFGVERSKRLNPFRSYRDRGMQWGGGSDFFVTPFPARYGIWSSIARQPLLGIYGHDAFGDDQSVDVRTALRSYTIWAAHQMFMEDRIGSIETGKYADIAVWDTDLYTAAPEAIKDMECRMTLLEGEVVYRAEPD